MVKDGHTFTQDLMNWRSRALAASDKPQSDGVGGKERSWGVGEETGELFRRNDDNEGVGVAGPFKRSWLMAAKDATMGETEAGTQFSVCRFENLGIKDSICRYKDYQPKVLSNVNLFGIECVPLRPRPN